MGRQPTKAPLPKKVMEDFGRRLSELSAIKFGEKITQKALALRFGVSQPMVGKYMRGEAYPSRANAVGIALVIGCGLEYLETGRGPKWVPAPGADEQEHIDITGLSDMQKEAIRSVYATFRQPPSPPEN